VSGKHPIPALLHFFFHLFQFRLLVGGEQGRDLLVRLRKNLGSPARLLLMDRLFSFAADRADAENEEKARKSGPIPRPSRRQKSRPETERALVFEKSRRLIRGNS
jgi:hypothetical protein